MKQESSRPVYSNPWVSLREDQISLPDGSPSIYSVLDAPDFALVVPFEDGGFHLVEQYRYPVGARSWEFPSGAFPPGVTGTPEQMATAELREETGFTAGRLERLGYLKPANGFMSLGCHVFLATELTPGEPEREATEQDMCQKWFPRTELERMLRDGEITDGPSVAAYLLFKLRS